MATLPKATTSVSETAGAQSGGVDLVCVVSPVATSADITPRQFGTAAAVYAQHGYNEGVEYVALHAQLTRKPFLFVGIPIVTQGVIGRTSTGGNTGTCVPSAVAGGSGVLAEHDGVLKVLTGGTIGTDQIKLSLSLDGGRTFKSVRLGTGNSYTIPYFGVTLNFAAGTLVTGDTCLTWSGSAPRGDATGWQNARIALAAQQRGFRSWMHIGDLQNSTEANSLLTQLNAYETANQRFIYGRAGVLDRLPLAISANTSHQMTGNPNVTFAEVGATGDTITRAAGSFISDGFAVGDLLVISGSASNNLTTLAKITGVTATVLTLDTDDLTPEGPVGNVSIIGRPSLTFLGGGQTITRAGGGAGSWLDDGFRVGDSVTITGSASNNVTRTITALTATVMTVNGAALVGEIKMMSVVSITTGQTKAAWMAACDAAFAVVDDAKRIDLDAGRGRILSPFSLWYMRRRAGWFASLREYQHDLHIATWKKDDGPVGADLYDASQVLVEWDDRVDGEAGSAARFTTMRTWGNGPQGAFIAQSLTRALEGSLLSQTHNMSVVNLACTTVQRVTENVIGRLLVLNDDGTATSDSLKTIETEVNAALELALLKNRGEGPRASSAVWSAATTDILNVPNALLTGTLILNLNGTIHDVATTVRVRSGGQ